MKKGNQGQNLPKPQENDRSPAKLVATSFNGPLPPPSILQGYEDIQPGFAERIVHMAESESAHRHELERRALDADIDATKKEFLERRIGQILAFLIVIIMAGIATYLAVIGREITASVFGGPAIAAIVGAFLSRRKENKNHFKEQKD